MNNNAELTLAQQVVAHLSYLLNTQQTPEVCPELSSIGEFEKLATTILTLREVLQKLSVGELEHSIKIRGYSAGCLKALQSHLRHLMWQVEQVANGDFTQRVDFLGEFSASFNSMVVQLDTVLSELRQKKETLSKLTDRLQREVELRKKAMDALAQSEAKYRHLAEYDPLTNCMNRRSFLVNAIDILNGATLHETPCCIAIMDIDHFKRLNDTYGHAVGDEVLKHVTTIGKQQLRDSDMIARFGGEEFLFLFYGTSLENGKHAAGRINKAIAETPYRDPNTELDIVCTVSIGVCLIPPYCSEPKNEDFIQRAVNIADTAMYTAKKTGRNKVVTAEEYALCREGCFAESDCFAGKMPVKFE
ncbi:MAG: diguanylate cyclase [Desulfomicrobium sp.]|jgi:diguanylate cyclase (GGDEF)-like protein|nr:diguanylate cyclase [Desulfomicrobium sp.]NLV96917.1 diguanylate cyclase [Desulfovibrionales bacterium]